MQHVLLFINLYAANSVEKKIDVFEDLTRISVGIEKTEDLEQDFTGVNRIIKEGGVTI